MIHDSHSAAAAVVDVRHVVTKPSPIMSIAMPYVPNLNALVSIRVDERTTVELAIRRIHLNDKAQFNVGGWYVGVA